MRRIVAAMVMTVDGFIEGPDGELDWVDTWEDRFDLLEQVDTCVLGGRMYPGYETYWRAVLDNPAGPLPFSGKAASPGEVAYAAFANRTRHVVVSRTLPHVTWPNSEIARDIDAIRRIKGETGNDIYAIGGAALVSSLLSADLLDELRLVIAPILLGAGRRLFDSAAARRPLHFVATTPLSSGMVRLTYGAR